MGLSPSLWGSPTKAGDLSGDGENPRVREKGVSLRPELAFRHPLSGGDQARAPTWAARACHVRSGARAGGASPAWPAAATRGPAGEHSGGRARGAQAFPEGPSERLASGPRTPPTPPPTPVYTRGILGTGQVVTRLRGWTWSESWFGFPLWENPLQHFGLPGAPFASPSREHKCPCPGWQQVASQFGPRLDSPTARPGRHGEGQGAHWGGRRVPFCSE